jgi:hypothetical protein
MKLTNDEYKDYYNQQNPQSGEFDYWEDENAGKSRREILQEIMKNKQEYRKKKELDPKIADMITKKYLDKSKDF